MSQNTGIWFVALLFSAFFCFTCSNNAETYDSNFECEANFTPAYNFITIQFNNGGEPEIDNPYDNEIAIGLNGENVIVQNVQNISSSETYNLVVSGTTENGSLKIYGNREMGLYLKNASITNPSGPAINIQNHRKISVHLVGETQNYLADGASYGEPVNGEDAKGAFFSESQISFSGCGSLEITGRHAHAIVVDNDIEIENGRITVVEAARDGVHANGEINIKGGILDVASTGDAIQSENLSVRVLGGKVVAKTTGIKSHGISSTDSVIISGDANVKIDVSGNGSKGIKSDGFVAITGGVTDIKTSGSRYIDNYMKLPDTSSAVGIKVNNNMEISGGALEINALGAYSKGINVEGNLTIKKGDVKIKADDDGIKVHGDLYVISGNICVWSLRKDGIDCNGAEIILGDNVNGDKCLNGF